VAFVKDSDMFEQSQIIAVPARDKMLNLEIIPNKKEFKPRDVASYTVVARNEDGSPRRTPKSVSVLSMKRSTASLPKQREHQTRFLWPPLQSSADQSRH
jgi:hypothetical protein